MIRPLVQLHARRIATVAAILAVAAAPLVASWSHPARTRATETTPVFAEQLVASGGSVARAAWIAALVIVVPLVLWVSGRTPANWYREEGDWLATSPAPRTTVVASCLLGLVLGAAVLAAIPAPIVGTLSPATGDGELLEPSHVAGSARSQLIRPGDAFRQSFASVDLVEGDVVRVRVTPTLGGQTPTSRARITMGGESIEAVVARRTWLEIDVVPGADDVLVKNVGTGAIAVVGPNPVEVWRPSRAFLGGHLRVAAHAVLFAAALAALALGLGAWMSPGLAGALALSLWLFARGAVSGGPLEALVPGCAGLDRSLSAIAEGRSPLAPPIFALAAAATLISAGGVLARLALGSWRRDGLS
ncbi:MAG: hypothetical protein AAF726_00995 [Planctomycetota bacterium]